jgi:hypothetical protein
MRTHRSILVGVAAALAVSLVLPVEARADKQTPFTPLYPTGATYSTWVDTLDNFGLLSDTNGNGQLNDERCDSNATSAQMITFSAEKVGYEFGKTVCEGLVEPADSPCWVALAIVAEVVVATEVTISQCETQDAAVDGAEIHAAWQNTLKLIEQGNAFLVTLEEIRRIVHDLEDDQIEKSLLACAKLVNLRLPATSNGRAEQVSDLVTTRIAQFEATGLYGTTQARHIANAKARLQAGDAARAAGRYSGALFDYCRAYREIALTGD